MTEVRTLSIRYVRATIETAERFGIARARFLQLAQFDPARLEEDEGRISAAEFSRLCELVLELSGNPALGLHSRGTGVSFNIVTPLVSHASTLRRGFETLLQVHKLLSDKLRYQLFEDKHRVTLRCASMEGVSERVRRYVAETEASGFCRMIAYFGAGARPELVSFEHAAPDYRAEYTRTFDGLERFDQPFTGIVFDRALLDTPSLYKDEHMHAALRAQAENRIARIEQRASYAERVRDFLEPGALSRTDMETVARSLGLSTRSLRRRLAAENTSYQAVVDDVLAKVAKRHLLVDRYTIQQTAFAMGYAGSGAFHRVFRRWTGVTPSEFLAERKR